MLPPSPNFQWFSSLCALSALRLEPIPPLSVEVRHRLRQEQVSPLLVTIRQQIEAAQRQVLPGSQLGKACKYTLSLWDKLTRFLQYPELELSNNLAENSMRPIAVGRRNWIHIGSLQAGPKIAAIISIVESCRRLKIPCVNTWLPFFQEWPTF